MTERAALVAVAVVAILAAAEPASIRGGDCIRARIGGHLVCLRPALPCQPRYERLYRYYGFTCRRDALGRYRLRARNFIAPPTP